MAPLPAIPFAAGAISRAFLNYACSEVRVEGVPAFLERLRSDRGILTIANHVSVCDEPFMWGVLPLSTFADSRTVRWTLGASDMMFNGMLDSWFFRKGQVIETFRGKGIYQAAIDDATRKLNEGRWIHIFPEGKIKQEALLELRRFKWGISRMLMEAKRTPLIIPVWIQGFEQVMHESRTFPRLLPRPGKKVTIVIGEPINDVVEPLLAAYRARFPVPWRPASYAQDVVDDLREEPQELAMMRSRMAEVMREMLGKLGQRVNAGQEGV